MLRTSQIAVAAFVGCTLTYASTVRPVECIFKNPEGKTVRQLFGNLDQSDRLTVTRIVGDEYFGDIKKADEDINNNPIAPTTLRNDKRDYEIDALSQDNDYGDIYNLVLPKKLSGSSLTASLVQTTYSRGPQEPQTYVGSCALESSQKILVFVKRSEDLFACGKQIFEAGYLVSDSTDILKVLYLVDDQPLKAINTIKKIPCVSNARLEDEFEIE